ncbi:GlxA family transcriptional regulator [Chitinophaga nivalis]|uniref:DJ-1/PfpI family protein n=1 Tax=Chitinophaga nivalis TaxID=2991709 RepID=A0ABT3IK05_9BACT|nr:DJ-1/PfpI family protein [Chitinophaga nivalis]MCW3466030.1 DJ-1/PfpI family protein [Chitinophaga nivalis]MCW3484279.1 DJ-1/PfpI family protein [Chitinophaga nivalis]
MQVVFMLPPQVHLLDLAGPAHIFYEAACYGAPIQLVYSSIYTGESAAVSSAALSFRELVPFDQLTLRAGDLVFVPGLDSALLFDPHFNSLSAPFQQWLYHQHQQGITVCAVCTGAFLLAAAGLLDHKNCTTHWKYTSAFSQRYPAARLLTNRLFVEEAGIYTSAGVASGIDLALYLTEQLWGPQFAAKIAKEVVIYFRRTSEDEQLNIFTQYRNHLDQRIHEVQDILSRTPSQRHTLAALAQKVHVSPRNLTRLFRKTTGITIGAYQDQLRTTHARQLLGEGHTLQAAAQQCGFKSINSLRRLLQP